jgi:hypothetical protein
LRTVLTLSGAQRKHIALIVLVFIATRTAAYVAGMRYLDGTTVIYWQFLDLDLLRFHLARVLLHLHSQPPILNALVGLSEKIVGSHYGQLILALQLLFSLAAIISVYVLLTQLQLAPVLSLVVSGVILLNPAQILFEFDPLYTEFVTSLNCLAGLSVVCYLRSRSTLSLYGIVGCVVLLTLVRSSYQWIYLVSILMVLWWQLPESRPQIRRATVLGVLLVLAWPAKNYILFHHFTSSTWGAYSMSKHWRNRSQAPMNRWIEDGVLPTFVLPFEASDEQQIAMLKREWPVAPTGTPELDDLSKSVGGAPNWNSLSMLRMHEAQEKDVLYLLRHDPKQYVVSVSHALTIYFQASSTYFQRIYFQPSSTYSDYYSDEIRQYRDIIRFDRIARRICCSIFGIPPDPPAFGVAAMPQSTLKTSLQRICVGAVLANGCVLLFVVSLRRRSLWADNPDRKVAAMVMTVTIAYGFLVATILDVGENMRFRFETQPLVLAVAAIVLQQFWDKRTRVSRNI